MPTLPFADRATRSLHNLMLGSAPLVVIRCHFRRIYHITCTTFLSLLACAVFMLFLHQSLVAWMEHLGYASKCTRILHGNLHTAFSGALLLVALFALFAFTFSTRNEFMHLNFLNLVLLYCFSASLLILYELLSIYFYFYALGFSLKSS